MKRSVLDATSHRKEESMNRSFPLRIVAIPRIDPSNGPVSFTGVVAPMTCQ